MNFYKKRKFTAFLFSFGIKYNPKNLLDGKVKISYNSLSKSIKTLV